MKIQYTSAVALWLLLSCVVALGDGTRKLTAVPKKAHLKRRDQLLEPMLKEQTLHYGHGLFDDFSLTPLAASITLDPKLPTLLLDDIDGYITNLVCNETNMMVWFSSELAANTAMISWGHASELLFVTSRESCGNKEAHTPYVVSQPVLDTFQYAIVLKATKTTFKSSCHKVSVDTGGHILTEIDTRELRRRSAVPQPQQSSDPPVPYTSSNIQIAPSTLTVSFEYPTPTSALNTSQGSKDISFSRIDTTLIPPDGTIASLLTSVVPIPDDITLKCLNCTVSGDLSFQAAGFSVTTDPTISDKIVAIDKFFDEGYIQFNTAGIFANMSFELDFQPGFTVPVFEARLPDIPLGAFEIQEVLTFGPVLQLLFPISVTLTSPLTFQAGFTLEVPPDSSIVLNVSNITSSSSQGFQDAKLTPLPFNANADGLSLNFSVGFQPKIVLGAALFEDVSSGNDGSNSSSGSDSVYFQANGGVGTYLDLPQLVTKVSQVSNTNDHCEASANNSDTYIHIEPVTSLVAGVEWNLDVGAFGVHFERGGGVVMYETSLPLPTQCLKWDSGAKTLTSAAPADSSNAADHLFSKNALRDLWCPISVVLGIGMNMF